ncbi:TIM-barrel domain-containing protein [Homoserinibacter sp. GY 40078]|uniref:glycoside hydrolase family 31 protein n=1 Tax=Homoserinibacter sp. GY 40078 TaxID=2603275 RepID=UPI0011C904D8|nr:TIM-barrel domain-containing protein [Homoserinibacter sp. GY 40078]TXK19703.1 glycoside hydrolase family 31 [Homoserinibacter sp. GY 40078]
MIRHRPAGSGHPYAVDSEQRFPVDPVAGRPLVLGVRADAAVSEVRLEWQRDGVAQPSRELSPQPTTVRGRIIDGGHLASAQARLARAAGGWSTELDGLVAGEQVRYRFVSDNGGTRWFETEVAGWREGAPGLVEAGTSRIVPGSVSRLVVGERTLRIRFALPLAPGERVVGFGERYDALDQRGTELDSVVFEQYKDQGRERRTYLPMPFAHVIGGSGWGFHVRTSRRVWFDVGASTPELLWAEAETGADGALELALYDGTPREVLRAFLAEAGSAEELPDWGFRLWASGNEWNTQAEVMRQLDLHRAYEIPVGSLVIEAWSDESTFTTWRDAIAQPVDGGTPRRLGDFVFPAEGAWPDPKGMVDELHSRGIRVHLWQIPLIKMRPHPTGQAAEDAAAAIRDGVLIREETPDGGLRPYRNRGWWFPLGLMPDLTDDRAARWWTEKRRYLVDEVGIDGFKTDGGEHAWGRDLVYLDGRRGDEMNNLYPVHYAKAYGDLLRRSGKAPVTFSRAGFTGSQAHGAFWAGDENSTWEAFRWSLLAGLNAAASGIVYWGWDLAGFSGDVPTPELYLRSAAAAAFVPIMQYHSEFNHHRTPSRDRTPWNIQERTGDDRVIPVFREFARLRERLVPYLAEEARRAVEAGEPLMRPVFFDAPDAPEAFAHPFQWMLGDELLVAPVVEEGASVVTAWLPPGTWVDAFTGDRTEGGVVRREVPIDEIAVWIRADAAGRLGPLFRA